MLNGIKIGERVSFLEFLIIVNGISKNLSANFLNTLSTELAIITLKHN
jgi:hypothetical protein